MATNNTRQAAWVAIGSLFSYGFLLLSSIILSRQFNKEDYGTFQQVLYVYQSLLAVFTLGLPKAYSYFLPKINPEEAKDVINKITNIFFILGALFSGFLFVSAPLIANFLNNAELRTAIKLFSPVPFFILPTMGIEGILATYRKTRLLALYTATTKFIMLCCIVLPTLLWNGGYEHSIIGMGLSSFFSFILAIVLKYYPVRGFQHGKSELKYKQIFSFSLPLLYASIGGILINSTDQFFISRYFGRKAFAEFSNGAFELPFATLVISATSTVLLPMCSKLAEDRVKGISQIRDIWISTFRKSSMIIYPIIIFCVFYADRIMEILYGIDYIASGDYFSTKVIVNFTKVLPYASILIAFGAVTYYAKTMLFTFIVLSISEYIAIVLGASPIWLVGIHTFYVSLQAIVFIKYIAKKTSTPLSQLIPWRALLNIILIAIICSVLTIIKDYALDITMDKYSSLILNIILYSSLYLLFCHLAGINYLEVIRPIIRNK